MSLVKSLYAVLLCCYTALRPGRACREWRDLLQGRSQDFSVGTHSFPSHLFTPPPPPQKKKIKVIFDSRVFYFKSRAQES